MKDSLRGLDKTSKIQEESTLKWGFVRASKH
jgi:hypothetical protein